MRQKEGKGGAPEAKKTKREEKKGEERGEDKKGEETMPSTQRVFVYLSFCSEFVVFHVAF